MNDLRGSSAPKKVKFGIKSKLIGLVLVAAVMGIVGVFFLTSSPTTAAQSLTHGPTATQSMR